MSELQAQLDRIEGRLDNIARELAGPGKWMHTLKAAVGFVVMLVGWCVVYEVRAWLR